MANHACRGGGRSDGLGAVHSLVPRPRNPTHPIDQLGTGAWGWLETVCRLVSAKPRTHAPYHRRNTRFG